jgi:hypothetical protein
VFFGWGLRVFAPLPFIKTSVEPRPEKYRVSISEADTIPSCAEGHKIRIDYPAKFGNLEKMP